MNYFLNLLLSGVAIGAVYGMLAMGYALIFKVSRVVNFAQGEVTMLIAYVAYSVGLQTGAGLIWVSLAIILSAMLIGAAIERLVIRPMLGQPVFSIVMMTIALGILIRAAVGMIWGSNPTSMFAADRGEMWQIFGVSLLPGQVALLALYFLICATVWLWLRFSMYGIAMRAAASDQTVTMLMGVSVPMLSRLAWCISALIAGVAGVLFANIYHLGPELAHLGIRAFPATILGGLDSVIGSAFGGVLIGIVENLAGGYLGASYKEIAGFIVIVAVLMIRPYGLFGQKDIERV